MKKFNVLAIVGYLLLLTGILVLDQTTKLHSEKAFLEYSHPTDPSQFAASRHRVFSLGFSPGKRVDSPERREEKLSDNWLDFHLSYTRNRGAAWGLFSWFEDPYRLWFFHTINLIAFGAIGYMFYNCGRQEKHVRFLRVAMTFLFAGAAGNFIDRLLIGYVIDWVKFDWRILGWKYNFPLFNVADISINVGIWMFVFFLLFLEEKKKAVQHPVGKD